ncbi:MAG: hypothetical protein KDJ34_12940 [Candidatus Competibacteraceae bacterium]|nr:hypothetical protein [Candidatus Competibacteraceae bacterium]
MIRILINRRLLAGKYILNALAQAKSKYGQTAAILSISRTMLWRKMR